MDKTERVFKLSIDIILTWIIGILLQPWLNIFSYVLGFWVAHSLNFIFNAQIWTLLRIYGYTYITYEKYHTYINDIRVRISNEGSISEAYAIGSLARNEPWHPYTDFDIRLIRKKGLHNGIRSCLFTLIERSRALFAKFPLDIYLLDDKNHLKDINQDEEPYCLK